MASGRPLSPILEEFDLEDIPVARSFHEATMEALGMRSDSEFQNVLLKIHEHEAARTHLHPYNHLKADDNDLDSFKAYSEDVTAGLFDHLNLYLLQDERDMLKDLVPSCTDYVLSRLVDEPKEIVCKRVYQEVECLILEMVNSRINGQAQAAGSRAETQYARLYATVSETKRLLLKFREVTDWCLDNYSRTNADNLIKIDEQVDLWVRAINNNKWMGRIEDSHRGQALIGSMQQENSRFQHLAAEARKWIGLFQVVEKEVVSKAESRSLSVQNELAERATRICNRI